MNKLSSLIITSSLLLGTAALAQGPKGTSTNKTPAKTQPKKQLTAKEQAQQKTKEELVPNQRLDKNTSRESYVFNVIRGLKEKILKKYALDPNDVIDPATLGHAPYQIVDTKSLRYIENPALSAKDLAFLKDQWKKSPKQNERPSYLVVDPASIRYIDDPSINLSELNAWKSRWGNYRNKVETTWNKLSPGEQEKMRKLNANRVEDPSDFAENWYFDKNDEVRISRVTFDDGGRRFRIRYTCENEPAILVNAQIKFDLYEVQSLAMTQDGQVVWAPVRYEMVGTLNNKPITAWLTPKNGSTTQFIIERSGDFAGGAISIDTFNPLRKMTIVTLPMRYRGRTYWGEEEVDFLDQMDGKGKEFNGKYRYANSTSDQKLNCEEQVDYLYVLDDDGSHDQDSYKKKDDKKKQPAPKPDVKTLSPVVVKATRKKAPVGNGADNSTGTDPNSKGTDNNAKGDGKDKNGNNDGNGSDGSKPDPKNPKKDDAGNGGAKEPGGNKNGNSPEKPKDPRPSKDKMDELNDAFKKGSKEGLTDAFKKMQQDPEWADEAIKRPVENFSTYTEMENKNHIKVMLSEDAFNELKKVQRGFKHPAGIAIPNPWAHPEESADAQLLDELDLGAKPIDGPDLNGKTWKRIPTPTPTPTPSPTPGDEKDGKKTGAKVDEKAKAQTEMKDNQTNLNTVNRPASNSGNCGKLLNCNTTLNPVVKPPVKKTATPPNKR